MSRAAYARDIATPVGARSRYALTEAGDFYFWVRYAVKGDGAFGEGCGQLRIRFRFACQILRMIGATAFKGLVMIGERIT